MVRLWLDCLVWVQEGKRLEVLGQKVPDPPSFLTVPGCSSGVFPDLDCFVGSDVLVSELTLPRAGVSAGCACGALS